MTFILDDITGSMSPKNSITGSMSPKNNISIKFL